MVIESIVYFLILLTAIPLSWLLSWLCDDELVSDRKWMNYTLLGFVIVLVLTLMFYDNTAVIFSLAYMLIVLALMIGFGKKWKFKN